ncbi:hypothetical protein [Burkholderia vietnamiensis]|uniref:hypothetical protein n=1 Tax=Burkholderia vietnamiensis TaxID=60552 RepID=UPI0012D8FF70|nr:hypothetical protein [Burkholderia vietnamiensis]MBR8149493.1 hypothetical protein [Burkholderia vietnamiensis]
MIILIGKPFQLSFGTIEADEYVPSMRMQVLVHAQQFGQTTDCQSSVWFACSTLGEFVTGLNDLGSDHVARGQKVKKEIFVEKCMFGEILEKLCSIAAH